jgi:hypothetical protein
MIIKIEKYIIIKLFINILIFLKNKKKGEVLFLMDQFRLN